MMKKVLDIIKVYKFAIITALIILLIGMTLFWLLPINKRNLIKEIDETNYYLSYDNSWKVNKKSNNLIVLKHSSGSKLTIQISSLTDEYSYATMNELIDELIYNMQKQNPNYKLLSKTQDKLTKDEFDGYKILYENGKEQVMVDIYKKGDKLVLIQYEAKNDYFDILLDSVQSIIYSLNIKDEKFDLSNSLKLNITDPNYSKSKELDKTITKSKTYEVAHNNYYVKYSIPSNFILRSLDSSFEDFDLALDSGKINLTVNIFNKNIYEYLNKDETNGVYTNYKYYKTNKDYSDFEETLTKLKSNYDSYIYKNSYYYNKAVKYDKKAGIGEYKRKDENAELIYALNNSHILVISIKTTGVPITEKLINNIKIKKSKNYASYVKTKKENNLLIGTLQRYSDNSHKKIDYITLKVPDKYQELDKNTNIYLERNYALNYNEDMLIYDYEVHYELTTFKEDFIINNINTTYISSNYGESHQLTYSGDLTLNDKVFRVYDGGYTDLSGIMFTDINRQKYYVTKKVLVYKISDEEILYIEIDGNGKGLGDDVLKELTNFIVEIKEN